MRRVNKKEAILSVALLLSVVILLGYVAFSGKDGFLGLNFNKDKGVEVVVLKEGSGTPIKTGDRLAVNYIGSLDNGEVFESNAGEEPYEFVLGETRVIPGWEMGIAGMKLGEKRKIVIEPEYAYGEKGFPGVVPPYATLVYEVDLVAINSKN